MSWMLDILLSLEQASPAVMMRERPCGASSETGQTWA